MVSISVNEYECLLVAESSVTTTLTQAGASVACVATHIPWVNDYGASNHITGTTSILSDVSTSSHLPRVTLRMGLPPKYMVWVL